MNTIKEYYVEVRDLKDESSPYTSGKYKNKNEAISFINWYNSEMMTRYKVLPKEFLLVGVEVQKTFADNGTFYHSSIERTHLLEYPALVSDVSIWMLREASRKTESGNYVIYSDEIEEYLKSSFNIDKDITRIWLNEKRKELLDALDSSDMTLSETWVTYDEDGSIGFDMNLCLAYCPNAEPEKK